MDQHARSVMAYYANLKKEQRCAALNRFGSQCRNKAQTLKLCHRHYRIFQAAVAGKLKDK